MRFFIHNSFHCGDIVLTRPVILAIHSSFPDVDITLECNESQRYLWEDLGLPIVSYQGNVHTTTEPTPNCPNDSLFINMWFGVFSDILYTYHLNYENNVHTFNRQMHLKNLQYGYQLALPEFIPQLAFKQAQPIPFEMKKNGILLENGLTLSGYNSFPLTNYLHELARDFPELTFYCSAKPFASNPNVVDLSYMNLLQLSAVSDQCTGLLTVGSGVNAVTHTETNRFKPRCIVGMSFPWRIWIDERNPDFEAKDINEVKDFLASICYMNTTFHFE